MSPKTILLVDDLPTTLRSLEGVLGNACYDVMKASSGEAALEIAKGRKQPDMVITDLHMGPVDGIQLIKALRQMETFRFKPIVMLTGESGREKHAQAKGLGATGWLLKPVQPAELLQVVRQVLPGQFAPAAGKGKPNLRPVIKVLVVEDSATFRMLIRQQLLGMEIVTVLVAADGSEALEIINESEDIDVIISDWHMAPMDGLTLCGEIQKSPRLQSRQIPIVFITADHKVADAARSAAFLEYGRRLGLVWVLPKPWTADQLKHALSETVGLQL